MDRISSVVVDSVAFSRTVVGLMTRPYETYRRIVHHGRPGEFLGIAFLAAVYFALASLIKVAAFRPFLFTEQFISLFMGAVSGVLISAGMLRLAGRFFGSATTFHALLLAWSYTLLPTVLWFFSTSLLYVVLPPPRTTSAPGVIFSLLFIVFSATLLWWKITLAYLVLRFGFKFDLKRNIIVAIICAPVLAAWSILMYKWGIFKVPFL